MIKEVEQEVSLIDIKNLYEYCFEQYKKDGLSVNFSMLIYKNLQYLVTPYNQISTGLWDELKDPKYDEYSNKMNALIKQYVDRDEQGNPIIENDEPRITENIVEFNKAVEEVEKDYKDLIEKIENKTKINTKFLMQKVKIKYWKLPLEEIPATIPPFIVGMIADT